MPPSPGRRSSAGSCCSLGSRPGRDSPLHPTFLGASPRTSGPTPMPASPLARVPVPGLGPNHCVGCLEHLQGPRVLRASALGMGGGLKAVPAWSLGAEKYC